VSGWVCLLAELGKKQITARRRARDRVATISINTAGAAVIGLLMLMLAFLIYVSLPLGAEFSIGAPRTLALDDQQHFAVRAEDASLWRLEVPQGSGDVDRASEAREQERPLGIWTHGDLALQLYPHRLEVFELAGMAELERGDAVYQARWQTSLALPGLTTASLGVDGTNSRLLLAYYDEGGDLHALSFARGSPGTTLQRWTLSNPAVKSRSLLLDASLQRVLAVHEDRYLLWQIPEDKKGTNPLVSGGQFAGLGRGEGVHAWGPSRETLLIGRGTRLHRFDALRPGFPRLGPPLNLDEEAQWIASELNRRVTYALAPSGAVSVLVPTTGQLLYQGALLRETQTEGVDGISSTRPTRLTLSGDAHYLYELRRESLTHWPIRSGSPETRWRSLWTPQWYAAYDEASHVWHPDGKAIGVLSKFALSPLLYGTFKAALYGMVLAVPLALGAAIYTGYFLSPRRRDQIKPALELLEAFPTVVLGFIAGLWLAPLMLDYLVLFLVLPILLIGLPLVFAGLHLSLQLLSPRFQRRPPRIWILVFAYLALGVWLAANVNNLESWLFPDTVGNWLWQHFGLRYEQRNALLVGLAMGIAITPSMFSIVEDAIHAVPRNLSDGALALGATRWQSLARVVLPAASPALLAAVLIGFARGLGETMIVLLATGNTPLMQADPFSGLRSLSASIAVELPEAAVGGVHFRLLFAAALLLFVLTFLMNTIAEGFRQRLRYAYATR